MFETDDRATSRGSTNQDSVTGVIQPVSRRERRELEAKTNGSALVPAAIAPASARTGAQTVPAIPAAPASVVALPVAVPPAAARAVAAAVPPRPSFGQRTRSRVAGVGTMAVVAAIVGVFAIPAYAIDTESVSASATASSTQQAQDFTVDENATLTVAGRDGFQATSYEQYLEQQAAIYRSSYASSVAQEGDDYPYRGGSGLSDMGYYIGQCTDFVAWRLNRDAGATSAPWKYTWSYMTPWGGDADQWLSAWYQHGWPVSTTPIVGSVAWFGGNHVGYVKEVYADGSVMIEDYNRVASETYGREIFAAGSIPYFLYPPG